MGRAKISVVWSWYVVLEPPQPPPHIRLPTVQCRQCGLVLRNAQLSRDLLPHSRFKCPNNLLAIQSMARKIEWEAHVRSQENAKMAARAVERLQQKQRAAYDAKKRPRVASDMMARELAQTFEWEANVRHHREDRGAASSAAEKPSIDDDTKRAVYQEKTRVRETRRDNNPPVSQAAQMLKWEAYVRCRREEREVPSCAAKKPPVHEEKKRVKEGLDDDESLEHMERAFRAGTLCLWKQVGAWNDAMEDAKPSEWSWHEEYAIAKQQFWKHKA